MRIRKRLALGGAILIFVACLIIYRMADYTLYVGEDSKHEIHSVQISASSKHEKPSKEYFNKNSYVLTGKSETSSLYNKCKTPHFNYSAHIQMSEVYKGIKFDNVDGGAWKQGWNIKINPNKWNNENKLKVFVVPHSHNDPGWLKTFEDYYTSETRNILNNMLKKLTTDSQKKFIWAEISFFSLWWNELSEADQEKVRRLLQQGQLEIVTGGWVMNDEANTHFYSMLIQLTEGHQWMKKYIQVEPKNGWTIDPFGESPVMAFLLNRMGLKNLVIQRVHYSVKKYFAQTKNLEFRWRQFWDQDGSGDILTHMTPFYSYDIPHTCGPDPKICCQFDFKRLPGSGLSCPWKEPPKPITKKNVAIRAEMLLDQYRKKSELYRTNVILVPLGDDFRYQYMSEWDNQFENYYKIMTYVNGKSQLHAEIRFGTLADFFEALTKEAAPEYFPTLVGDFFTYADRDDHYWSGYYTSRPFYKRLERILMFYHRSAEIIFSLGWSGKNFKKTNWLLAPQTGFAKMLRDIRRSLGLFQHHDGITGTARDNVMEDYARKMLDAINYSQHVIQQVAHYLLSPLSPPYSPDPEQIYFDFDDHQKYLSGSPKLKVITLAEGETKTLVFFNSLTHKRKELASILVVTPFVEIHDFRGNAIPCQTSPFFSHDSIMDDTRYEISFVVEIPPLGLTSYRLVVKTQRDVIKENAFSKIKVFNAFGAVKSVKGFEDLESSPGREFSIENTRFLLTFNEKGLLKSITAKDTTEFIPLRINFVKYLARQGKERSGAYLFLPEGEASVIHERSPLFRLYDGPLFTRIEVKLSNVHHFLRVYNTPDLDDMGFEIINVVDILNKNNFELAMRVTSQVKNGNEFHTDLNGFQMIKRTRLEKLPIQGNFYPMPTAAFIEDDQSRITILSGQPLGVSSLYEGVLEVLQDRRLKQDDNLGLGQGVMDNRVTPNVFRISVEKRLKNCAIVPGALSVNAYRISQGLLNPFNKMIATRQIRWDLNDFYSPANVDLGNDMHLVSARTFEEEEGTSRAGLVFHRSLLDSCFTGSSPQSEGIINLKSFLPHHFGNDMKKTSLSFLQEKEVLDVNENQILCHMDFLSVVVS